MKAAVDEENDYDDNSCNNIDDGDDDDKDDYNCSNVNAMQCYHSELEWLSNYFDHRRVKMSHTQDVPGNGVPAITGISTLQLFL